MNIKKEVSLNKILKDAEDGFAGGFFCCEALVASVIDNFEMDVPKEVIAMTSGMAVGVGSAGCICGALNGGVMLLGMIFGRSTPDKGHGDPAVVKTMELTNELHDWFRKANGKNTNCCRILTKEFDTSVGAHAAQCKHFTGLGAKGVSEIIMREFGVKNLDIKA